MKKKASLILVLLALAGLIALAPNSVAAVTYNFDSNPPPDWGNERGSWIASSGVYYAQQPSSYPITYTSLPFALTDFTFDVDIANMGDGGIWLRSDWNGGAINGILLVRNQSGSLYWHIVANGEGINGWQMFNPAALPQSSGHFKVVVNNNDYFAYVDGVLKTSLNTDAYTSGRVGFYSYASLTFDNANLVPLPGTILLLGSGLLGLAGWKKLGKNS